MKLRKRMLFRFTPQDNFITGLNPLIKIAFLGTTAVFAFLLENLIVMGVYFLAILVVIYAFKINFGRALILIKLFIIGIPMLLIIFVLSYLWKEPTYSEGIQTGFLEGMRYSLRFLNLILMNFVVVLSTDPREIFYTFKVLRIPDTISQIMAHVVNLFPRLVVEIRTVVEAQRLRGMRWKNLWRPSSWLPLALPIVLATMRYSEQTAISLELRGGFGEISYPMPQFKMADWCVCFLCAALIAAAMVFK